MSTVANYIPEVRQQYEEFPYPERNPEDEIAHLLITNMTRIDAVNHFCYKGRQDFRDFRVLTAGGGTGDSLIAWAEQLRERKGSSVTYLDMSTASMGIAKKRADIRQLTNISWINDSILNLPNMGLEPFDHVDCIGVLHHLADPDAGLRALKSVLKPGGSMSLMVYAPYGRTSIYQVQELMRLVNDAEQNQRQKIRNTKDILKQLPQTHLYNISKKMGLWTYSDEENDAGIYDLFLHSQDRAYTILEAHDWLERCGLKMTGEPGSAYTQDMYLPEAHIQDQALLTHVKSHPLKIQQAIAEAICGRMAKHSFYASHADETTDTIASAAETDLVPYLGITELMPLKDLGAFAAQNKTPFGITLEKAHGRPQILVPEGKYMAPLLQHMDGQRTVGQVLAAVKALPGFTKGDDAQLQKDMDALIRSLSRGHIAFLRAKSIKPFSSISAMRDRRR